MTLTDALTKLEGLAKGASQGTREMLRYEHGGGRAIIYYGDGHSGLLADLYERGDRELFAACSPKTILALVRVARAAQEMKAIDHHGCELEDAENELYAALDELGRVMK